MEENIINLLNEKQKEKITIKEYNKGQIIFKENETCNCIGVVLMGEITITSYLSDGKEIVYNKIQENGLFANNLIFSSDKTFKGDIVSSKKSIIALIYENTLLELLSNNKAFLKKFLNIQSDNAKRLNHQIKLLSIPDAKERFLYHLHYKKNNIEYSSISSLAKTLFLRRETLSRLLPKLEKSDVIVKKQNVITKK